MFAEPLDPWRTVADAAQLSVTTLRLPDGMAGATGGTGRSWLDDRLTATERRCVLMHELVHVEAGHHGHQPEAVEAWVREQTARRLIPLEALAPWRSWQGTLWQLADELGVTHDVLADRLRTASAGEREVLRLRGR